MSVSFSDGATYIACRGPLPKQANRGARPRYQEIQTSVVYDHIFEIQNLPFDGCLRHSDQFQC